VSYLLISKISYACSARILNEDDIRFWLKFPTGYNNWKRAWEEAACFEKLLPIKNFSYKPWLIVIRNKLLQVENSYPKALSNPHLLAARILCVINWLSKPNHRNIVIWLLNFLFKEKSTDTKRPYLFMHGVPNSGKTFFMDILTPNTDDGFCMKNRTFAHFGSEKNGDYELHLLLFDDPGEAKGKMNQIDPSLILNLANNNIHHSLPVKFGFMNFTKGQIAIISNREAKDLFPIDSIEAMKTRLLVAELKITDPFPLRGKSLLCNGFVFQDLNLQTTDIIPPPLQENLFDENFINFDPSLLNPMNEEVVQDNDEEEEFLEKPLLFYILWRAIFKIIETQLQSQAALTFKSIVPNPKMRDLMKNGGNSLFDLICKKLSEYELSKLLD